ncbi:hypothetical protein [Streptomyces sp. 891-h]|uniref:hypothetical protein n=1 Tax=unclassified Streptomyces TaxID=2593676 RepID=UPI001FAA7972|nr:hypothetical protein [Streptomyces sp. 891-h]UNZ18701.1 hypothetical protein HC362_18335 [Streptomyces sp. 891-h]
MGIESDQLVFDYLSRVGDLAHSTRMTAAERARLVGGLRGEIDRARAAEGGAVTKAAVQKILDRLGRPEEVVASATGGESPRPAAPMPSSEAPTAGGRGSKGADTPQAPRPARDAEPEPEPAVPTLPAQRTGTGTPTAAFGASSPHLAGLDELGDEDSDPDWWRVDPSPFGTGPGGTNAVAAGEPVPGFVGGIELPEVLKPPPSDEGRATPHAPAAPQPAGQVPVAPASAPPAESPPTTPTGLGAAVLLRRLLRGKGEQGSGRGGVVEWAAAVLLVAGAVLGSLIPLAVGWLAAWWSPKLSRNEGKWAVLGMPGVVLGGTAVWLWGRATGRWGAHLAQGGDALREAMSDAFPVALRVAATASALYLVWRSRRPSQG